MVANLVTNVIIETVFIRQFIEKTSLKTVFVTLISSSTVAIVNRSRRDHFSNIESHGIV